MEMAPRGSLQRLRYSTLLFSVLLLPIKHNILTVWDNDYSRCVR